MRKTLRSVRWRLLLNSILISVVTILAVGVVTLLLVGTYFEREERAYLQRQGEQVAPVLASALAAGRLLELQRLTALAGYSAQMRVQVLDSSLELLLADSGPPDDLALFDPFAAEEPEVIIGVVVDETGRVVGFSPPLSRQEGGAGQSLSFLSPERLLGDAADFTGVSAVMLRLPLVEGGSIVGYLELSEGPAVGAAMRRGVWLALIGGSVVALLAAVAVGLLSARQVTRPLGSLGGAAEAMAAGDLAARAPQSRLQEFDRLAEQFNVMAGRLTDTITRLEQERDVLRRTIGDASHELRTPLTALKTFNALLHSEVGDTPPAADFVVESERQIEQLERLTADMLDLSRLEGRLSGTDFQIVDLRETVDAAVRALQPLSAEKGQQLHWQLPPEPLVYRHDPISLQRAFANILHNAIKFTPQGGAIDVRLRAVADSGAYGAELVVRDTGPGIPAEIQGRLFERFFRAGDGEGTGLGLAISREIVSIHGGTIAVESTAGEGAAFIIRLPAEHQSGG